jgi:hypothetical protein
MHVVTHRTLGLAALGAALALSMAAPARGQIVRRSASREPLAWASLSVGLFQPQDVVDGTTGSRWAFGNTAQYRATLEQGLQGGGAVGLAATFARTPLRYEPYDATGPAAADCLGACEAHADIWSALAMFRIGGGAGFHQVIELSAGAVGYSNFRRDDDGAKLVPSSDIDFLFAVGYGFGWTFADGRTQLVFVADGAEAVHQRERLPNDVSTMSTQITYRVGLRYGLGTRRGF